MELALEVESGIEESQLFYERPGSIANNHLLDSKFAQRSWLKRTLVEHFDYEVVSHKVWLHLYSWYSADITICRALVKDHQSKQATDFHDIGEDNPYQQPPPMPPMGGGMPMMAPVASQRSNLTMYSYKVFLDLFKQQEDFTSVDVQMTLGKLQRGETVEQSPNKFMIKSCGSGEDISDDQDDYYFDNDVEIESSDDATML